MLPAGQYPYPDIHEPHALPGKLNATNFDYGGEGVAYQDKLTSNQATSVRPNETVGTENGDGGKPNVGWIENGEWLEFTVNVTEAGWYQLNIRTASQNATPGNIQVLMDGELKYGPVNVKSTGSWTSFQALDLGAGAAQLELGEQIMRVLFGGGYNVSDLIFTKTTSPVTSIHGKPDFTILVYPNPATGILFLSGVEDVKEVISVDALGRRKQLPVKKEIDNTYIIETVNLPTGVYFLDVKNGKSSSFTRLLKQ